LWFTLPGQEHINLTIYTLPVTYYIPIVLTRMNFSVCWIFYIYIIILCDNWWRVRSARVICPCQRLGTFDEFSILNTLCAYNIVPILNILGILLIPIGTRLRSATGWVLSRIRWSLYWRAVSESTRTSR